MPSRLALLGASEGPWIDISRVAKPALRIVGLPVGAKIRIESDHAAPAEFESNGIHLLSRLAWVRVCCDAPAGHKTICVIQAA